MSSTAVLSNIMTESTPIRSEVRNIAIIAHVDHGKTTLVDGFLRQAGTFRTGEVVADCAMDSNDLERERGITILAKFTAITWKGIRVNIVDTPGHADFGGEVERVLKMVDSVLLLVDAFEGPMPQTRFVTRKALALGLRPILVVNKIDRVGCDPDGAVNDTFDLFCALGANEEQLDFPVIYASGREGYAVRHLTDEKKDLTPLLDLILESVPPPAADVEGPLAMHVATLDYDDYLGYVAIGRMLSGRVRQGERVLCVHRDGKREEFRVAKILGYQSLKRFELLEAVAGDICAITGMQDLTVGETITDIARPIVLPLLEIEEPTVKMQFISNNGPFAGKEGKPTMFDELQTLENPALRAFLKLDKSTEGIVVHKPYGKGADYPLKKWDLITRIGANKIDDQGMVQLGDNLRIRFQYLIQKLTKNGKVQMTVVRAGKEISLQLPVPTSRPMLLPDLSGKYPSYFIYGPLVFSSASMQLVSAVSGFGHGAFIGTPLLSRFLDPPAFAGEEIVVVSSPFLPHKLASGYSSPMGHVLSAVNRVPIRSEERRVGE